MTAGCYLDTLDEITMTDLSINFSYGLGKDKEPLCGTMFLPTLDQTLFSNVH